MNLNNVAELFISTVEKYPSRELYFYKKNDSWIGLTGKDVKITVEDIAFGLRALGIQKKSKIAILSNNSPRWAMCDYGIICSAMTTVTIYPTLIPKQIDFILRDSNTQVIFVENKEQLEKIKTISNTLDLKYIIVMDDSLLEESDKIMNICTLFDKGKLFSQEHNLSLNKMIQNINSDDTLTLIYTSGTTGVPKGVILTHGNLISNIKATLKIAPFNDNETFLSFLPLSHVLERMAGHFTAFSIGATTYYAESIEKVSDNLGEANPTIVISVPRLFEKIYTKIIQGLKTAPKLKKNLFYWALSVGKKYSELTLNKEKVNFLLSVKHKIANKLIYTKVKDRLGGRIKFFISGGAPLSKEIAEFFSSVNITILEGYGLTETSPVLSGNSPEFLKFGTVGKPLFNVEIKIANDGEILAKGPNIMKGYHNNEEATKEVFDQDGWFKTGDIGEIDKDGFLKITDRKKSLIVTSAGKNIAPAPIEGALSNSPYIEQILVIGDKRNFISALIVPNFESITNYLKSINNNLTDTNAIVEHEEVQKLFQSEVDKTMQDFSNYEQVKKFKLLTHPFTIEKGELTPKLSIVRKKVENNYANLIDRIYE